MRIPSDISKNSTSGDPLEPALRQFERLHDGLRWFDSNPVHAGKPGRLQTHQKLVGDFCEERVREALSLAFPDHLVCSGAIFMESMAKISPECDAIIVPRKKSVIWSKGFLAGTHGGVVNSFAVAAVVGIKVWDWRSKEFPLWERAIREFVPEDKIFGVFYRAPLAPDMQGFPRHFPFACGGNKKAVSCNHSEQARLFCESMQHFKPRLK